MLFLNILGTLLGIVFVLAGGCTVIFWGAMAVQDDVFGALPFIIVGGLIGWGGVALIRKVWRKRPPLPPGSQI